MLGAASRFADLDIRRFADSHLEAHINRRLTALRTRTADVGLDAALLLHPRDVLYYVGTVRPAALLVAPHETTLFMRRGLEYAREEATVARVEPMNGFFSVAQAVAELELTGCVLGTELDVVPAQIAQRLLEVFPYWSLADVSPLVLAQWAVKDEDEITATRTAASVADTGRRAVVQAVALGVSELVLAAEVEAAMRRARHKGFQLLRQPEARGGGIFLMSRENLLPAYPGSRLRTPTRQLAVM